MKKILLSILLTTPVIGLNAQFNGGGDLVSRYQWRGQLLSSGPSFQPYVSYITENDNMSFEIGAWGSYSFATTLSPDGILTDGSEADLYFQLGIGDFSMGMTDYYFPSDEPFAAKDDYFNYSEEDGTRHQLELNLEYSGPLSFAFNLNLAGADSKDSHYTEIGYNVTDKVSLYAAFGNGWYTTDTEFGMVGMGITYSKELKISETFLVPVITTFAINPENEKIFIIFGMSF